jgi:hypothetical protein
MGSLEDILSGFGGDLRGEVRQIDTRRQEVLIRSDRGRNERVLYDGRTEVIYRQRLYAIRDLEIGDYVRVRFDQGGRNRYASTIEVEAGIQDRQASRVPSQGRGQGPGQSRGQQRVQRIDGTVNRIDARSGWFEINETRGTTVLVTLPYQANRNLQDRFQRLRRGDRVRIEGEMLSGTRVELLRFL